jgi:Fe2+ or Zn2+ uptake regulation protein
MGRPLSLAEVVEEIGVVDWDRTTLFRNLVKLEEYGFGRVASSALGTTRYEAVDRHGQSHVHPHFACRSCKMVTCVREASLRIPQEGKWQAALLDADLQLLGLCPDCRG